MKINHKKGFTLIELLVVISIIGLLSTVVLASLTSARKKANNSFVTTSIKSYVTALRGYYADHGGYPIGDLGTFCLGKVNYGCFGTFFAVGYYDAYSTSTMYSNNELLPYLSSLNDPSPFPNSLGNAVDNRGAGFICVVQNGFLCLEGYLLWTIDSSVDKALNCGDVGGATNSAVGTPVSSFYLGIDDYRYMVGNYCILKI
jgi:prepilin-type N-terminal cleavage/methylation domain-containing protein